MNAFAKVDKNTFLRFAEAHAEQRCEYVRGRIVQQMTGGTKRHGTLARRITRLLEDRIDLTQWSVLQDRGVETSDTIRCPDVVVEPVDEPVESLVTRRPVLIVEVLSRSTAWTDLDVEPAEYTSLASLDVCIIASQSEPAILVYERDASGDFPVCPREVVGAGAAVAVDTRAFPVTFALAGLYDGIA